MCTVTVIPGRSGFRLAMNRDESLTRVTGLPPVVRTVDAVRVLHPSEPGGGTWISVNDRGCAFALVNWYAIAATPPAGAVSRGQVVLALRAQDSSDAAGGTLASLPLEGLPPFRVLGVFPADRRIVEWRWNLQDLEAVEHPWRPGQWSSSGFDEPGAQRERRRDFEAALAGTRSPDAASLDRLHASHGPVRGPYSTCMHRSDAATVSLTAVEVGPDRVSMRHAAGPPCCTPAGEPLELGREARANTAPGIPHGQGLA
jgi:hypothetical protein